MDTVRALLQLSLYIFFAAFQLFAIFNSNVFIFISVFSNPILKRKFETFLEILHQVATFRQLSSIFRQDLVAILAEGTQGAALRIRVYKP